MILVLMNSDGMKVLTDPNFKLGVDLTATIGPKSAGDQANFKTDSTPVLVYGDTRGLFGGAALQTGGVFPDGGDNEDYYGKKFTMAEILLGGKVELTEAAKLLGARIEQYSTPKPVVPVVQEPKPAPPATCPPSGAVRESTCNDRGALPFKPRRALSILGPCFDALHGSRSSPPAALFRGFHRPRHRGKRASS
jgi:hypothetical protein